MAIVGCERLQLPEQHEQLLAERPAQRSPRQLHSGCLHTGKLLELHSALELRSQVAAMPHPQQS